MTTLNRTMNTKRKFLKPHALVFLFTYVLLFLCTQSLNFTPLPTRLSTNSIHQSYPPNIFSTLFSSVPRRNYALKNITLDFDSSSNSIALLVGASASGKSTLLRILSGVETPKSGDVTINGEIWKGMGRERSFVRPIIVDRRPDFDNSLSVLDRILQSFRSEDERKGNDSDLPSIETIKKIADDFTDALGLESVRHQKPSELTPSQQFLFGVACACMKSCCCCCPSKVIDDGIMTLQYPILLLDEYLDFEHPDTVGRVSDKLESLTNRGAIVIVATHKPEHWKRVTTRRTITLSGGRVLMDDRAK